MLQARSRVRALAVIERSVNGEGTQPGEGVQFFSEGRSTPGGSLPINTNGGGLSYTHSGMYGIFPIIEATRQLRGECGPRQVPGASCSLVNGMGGMLSAAGTLVLATDR